ncbi:Gp49 family protein [Rhodanobacter lindaniclasticus]
MNDTEIEQEIQAKGLTAPRVTPGDVEAAIESEWYIRGSDAKADDFQPPVGAQNPLNQLTFCVLILRNGFTVTGESACASPENFDVALGRKIARQNAVAKIWPLLGFRLRDRLSDRISVPTMAAPEASD